MPAARLYQPDSATPFALSRSKVELFVDCPRCFYLDRRLGIARPPGFPFNLNSAVDALLKREFDRYRAEGIAHPLMAEGGIRAVPHAHPNLETWRNNFRGVRFTHAGTISGKSVHPTQALTPAARRWICGKLKKDPARFLRLFARAAGERPALLRSCRNHPLGRRGREGPAKGNPSISEDAVSLARSTRHDETAG